MRLDVICKSGLTGWENRLQAEYKCFQEFLEFSEMYGLAARLGFASANEAWQANPLVQGSTNPSDYCRVWRGAMAQKPELPITVKVVVELQVDAEQPLADWKLREGVEQAVKNALELVEKNGFSHEFADEMSIGVVDVSVADNDLENTPTSS